MTGVFTPAQFDTFMSFYHSVGGPMQPFILYEGAERTPLWSWDNTGVSTVGRYVGVFRGPLRITYGWPRHTIEVEIVEVV